MEPLPEAMPEFLQQLQLCYADQELRGRAWGVAKGGGSLDL